MTSKALCAVALACLGVPHLALADKPPAFDVYTDKAEFLAAVGEVMLQGFESYPTELCSTGGSNPLTTFVSDSFTVTTVPSSGGTSFLCIGNASGGPHPTEGNNALIAGSNTGDPWTLEFSITAKKVYAVGFYVTDAAESGDALFVTESGDEFSMVSCCQPSGNLAFFGVVAKKPFSSFQLVNTGIGDGWGIDEVMLALGSRGKKPN